MFQLGGVKNRKVSLTNQIMYRKYNIGNYNYNIRKMISHKRWNAISLNTSDSIEKVNTSAITCIDIENIAGRFMLNGYLDGIISVHDIYNVTYPRATAKYAGESAKLVTCTSKTVTHTNSITDLQWYPYDTGIFTSSSCDGFLYVWDTSRMIVADKYKYYSNERKHSILCHSISKHNNIVALGGDLQDVHLWSIRSGSRTHCLKGHCMEVLSLDWCQDCENLLASSGKDRKVILWDVRKHTEILFQLDQSNSLANINSFAHNFSVMMVKFIPGTGELVTWAKESIRVWDLRRFNILREIPQSWKVESTCQKRSDITRRYNALTTFIFVPSSNNIIMIDLNNGKVIKTLYCHYNRVNVCYVHPLEELMCSADNNDVLFWSPIQSTDRKSVRFEVPQTENIDAWSDSD